MAPVAGTECLLLEVSNPSKIAIGRRLLMEDSGKSGTSIFDVGVRLLPALGLMAGILWAVAQFALNNFYGDLRLDPDLAGWQTGTLLTDRWWSLSGTPPRLA